MTARVPGGHPLGFSRASEEFRTSSHRLAQFAQAVDDTNPRHLTGAVASPVFTHIPVMQSMVEVLAEVTQGLALHGEHDFIFHAPIRPGLRLFSVSTLQGVRGTRAGHAYVIRSDIRTHDGGRIATQYSTCLVRGEAAAGLRGDAPPQRPAPAETARRSETYRLSGDQTRRYADAARDYAAYTIDPAAAARHGFPAPLVHGMCSLAFAARAIIDHHCRGETPRLKRLGCRFAHPLYLTPDQTITVDHGADGAGLVGFTATDLDGNAVITKGYAEISA